MQLVNKIAVSPRCSVREVFWKTSQISHKKHSSGGVLSKGKMFLKVLQNSHKNIFSGVSFLIKLQAGNLKPSETTAGDVLQNKVLLKISQISQEITSVGVSF